MSNRPPAPRSLRPTPRLLLTLLPASFVGGVALCAGTAPAQAQVLRGVLDSATSGTGVTLNGTRTSGGASTGSGVLGTGLTVGDTNAGGVLGTGVGVGTSGSGQGVLGTGLTIGTTTAGGVLGTGVTIGTTNPGDGLLGTGLTIGTKGGTSGLPPGGTPNGGGAPQHGGQPTTVAVSQNTSLELRLTNTINAVEALPLRANNASGLPVPLATGADAVAVGYGSAAAGAGSIAIGTNANAGQDNAVAVGRNVRTTRAGQVAIGGGDSTYTLAGLPSAASRAAQSGPTSFVTTDAGGNLAASSYGPSSIAALDGRVSSLENNVAALQRDVRGAFQGTAIALSLGGAVLPAGKAFAVSANFGTYHGETAFGATGIARLTENLYASGGVGFAASGRTNVGGRGGLTLAW